MKKLIFLIAMIFGMLNVNAMDGVSVFEAASSSMNVVGIDISTSAYTLVSQTETASLQDGKKITWYSLTVFNISDSSMSYVFNGSDSTAPAAATKGAPIGTGTAIAPNWVTEQFLGMFMWVKAHGSSTVEDVRVVRRGR